MNPPILILYAPGTNRHREASLACRLAGGVPQIIHLNRLLSGEIHLADYRMLVIPGGFSFGDELGAGKLLALILSCQLGDQMISFIDSGKPVLGICNGFQALLRAGYLTCEGDKNIFLKPGEGNHSLALVENDSGKFECRWVILQPEPNCIFTRKCGQIVCPVAHGEGKLITQSNQLLDQLESNSQVALRYVSSEGNLAGYPVNPNGSINNIAGICNRRGNVLGLMPHPENNFLPFHFSGYSKEQFTTGLALFQNAVTYCSQL